MRTLIVEDVHFLAIILQRFIEPYSQSDFASNGALALDKFTRALAKGRPYDLICLDLLLPELDGFEVMEHIRQFERDAGISDDQKVKIIVISTFHDKKTVSKALAAGCDSYIAKPFRKDRVLLTLSKLGLIEYSIASDDDEDEEQEQEIPAENTTEIDEEAAEETGESPQADDKG